MGYIEKEFVVERDEIGEIGEISCWKVGWVGRGRKYEAASKAERKDAVFSPSLFPFFSNSPVMRGGQGRPVA